MLLSLQVNGQNELELSSHKDVSTNVDARRDSSSKNTGHPVNFDDHTNTMLHNDRSELRDFDLTTSEDVNRQNQEEFLRKKSQIQEGGHNKDED